MIEQSMINGPVLVKARKIALTPVNGSPDEFYLEFFLDGSQKNGVMAELMLAHISNNTMTINHIHDQGESETERRMKFLKQIVDDTPTMDEKVKNSFLSQIVELAKHK